MMTTVGGGGARPCHISHWTGAAPPRRGAMAPNIIPPSGPTGKSVEVEEVGEVEVFNAPLSLHLFLLYLFSFLFLSSPPSSLLPPPPSAPPNRT